MKVRVLSRAAVEDGSAESVDAVVSIRASAPEPCGDLDLAIRQAVAGNMDAALVLRFDDIGVPAFGPYVGPTMEDVSTVLDFARRVRHQAPDGTLAVHCLHGRSRSAAVALALIADEFGFGREVEAVAALLRQDVEGMMHPNPMVVSMADAALFRYGRLESALGEASPRYRKWRDHWRGVALDPERHWRKARQVRFRRRMQDDGGA